MKLSDDQFTPLSTIHSDVEKTESWKNKIIHGKHPYKDTCSLELSRCMDNTEESFVILYHNNNNNNNSNKNNIKNKD
jgi:hypothetical protein